MTDEANATAAVKSYDIRNILAALPHRYPLLLVDRVASLEIGERIHAIKAVSFNEQFFQGHFPGRPIMPGVLQIEALAQAAAILAIETLELAGSSLRADTLGLNYLTMVGSLGTTPREHIPGELSRLVCNYLQVSPR